MHEKIPALPFDWNLFVIGVPGDCVPSCVAMAARYWKKHNPSLPLPDAPEPYSAFVRKTANVSYRGTSLKRLLRNMPSNSEKISELNGKTPVTITELESEPEDLPTLGAVETHGLVLDPRQVASSQDLLSIFLVTPVIPTILVLDVGIAEMNKKWGQHAVLLHSIDMHREKIYVIDPMLDSMKEPRPMDLRRFEIGWKECQNTAIFVYPKSFGSVIYSSKGNNTRITEFMNNGGAI